jgi:hypothetical protein
MDTVRVDFGWSNFNYRSNSIFLNYLLLFLDCSKNTYLIITSIGSDRMRDIEEKWVHKE